MPRRLDLKSLFESLYGGKIHRVFLYNTGPYSASEALVAYVEPTAARRFYSTIRSGGIGFPSYDFEPSEMIPNQRTQYHVSMMTRKEIAENGLTRCLLLTGVPEKVTDRTVRHHVEERVHWLPGRKKTPLIESIICDKGKRKILLNMAGIYLAQGAKNDLKRRKEYRSVRFSYAPDPCDTSCKGPVATSPEVIDSQQPSTVHPWRFSLAHANNMAISSPRLLETPTITAFTRYRNALPSLVNPNPLRRNVVFVRLLHSTTLCSFTKHIRSGIVEGIYLYDENRAANPKAVVVFKEAKAAWHCYIYFKTRYDTTPSANIEPLPFAKVGLNLPRETNLHLGTLPVAARRCVRIFRVPSFRANNTSKPTL